MFRFRYHILIECPARGIVRQVTMKILFFISSCALPRDRTRRATEKPPPRSRTGWNPRGASSCICTAEKFQRFLRGFGPEVRKGAAGPSAVLRAGAASVHSFSKLAPRPSASRSRRLLAVPARDGNSRTRGIVSDVHRLEENNLRQTLDVAPSYELCEITPEIMAPLADPECGMHVSRSAGPPVERSWFLRFDWRKFVNMSGRCHVVRGVNRLMHVRAGRTGRSGGGAFRFPSRGGARMSS